LYGEYNKITTLPEELQNLDKMVVLILHHNLMEKVPEAIRHMKQLLRYREFPPTISFSPPTNSNN